LGNSVFLKLSKVYARRGFEAAFLTKVIGFTKPAWLKIYAVSKAITANKIKTKKRTNFLTQ
jgi:hypothetical protein